MVYGAATAGHRVLAASSGPGMSLKQEAISYIAGAELPCVVVDICRAGPGLGNIGPEQSVTVGFTVTLTTRISCFLFMTSARRINTGLAIKHPLHFAGMTYPSRGYRTRLQQKVCNIKSACAVGHAHTHGDRFHFGEVIFRHYLLRCFRKISHRHLHQ